MLRNILDRHMLSDQAYPEIIRYHQHQYVTRLKGMLQIRCMPRKVERRRLRIFFVDGSRHQPLYLLVPQRFHCRNQGFDGIASPDIRQLPGNNGDLLLPAIVNIDLFMSDPGKILCDLIVHIDLRRELTIEIDQLIRGKDQRSTQLQQTVIGKSLDDQLSTNAVQVANGNAYNGFLLWKTH